MQILKTTRVSNYNLDFMQPRSQSSSAISDVRSPVKLVGKIRRGRLANQPRSQSSSAISDVTSPVKPVGKIRTRFQASSGNSDSANRPGYEAGFYGNLSCRK